MEATVQVYRNGHYEAGEHYDECAEQFERADQMRPDGRAGRSESLFASADLHGVSRWSYVNLMGFGHTSGIFNRITRSYTIDPEGVFVYDISAWDAAHVALVLSEEDRWLVEVERYWSSGVPLTDFASFVQERGVDTRTWEVLVPAQAVQTFHEVPHEDQLAAVVDEERRQALSDLFAWQHERLCEMGWR